MEELIIGVLIFGFMVAILLFPGWLMKFTRRNGKNGFNK